MVDESEVVYLRISNGAILPFSVSSLNDMPAPNWWTQLSEEYKEYLATEWWKDDKGYKEVVVIMDDKGE